MPPRPSLALFTALLACGAAAPASTPRPVVLQPQPSRASQTSPPRCPEGTAGMQIEGQLGTLPRDAVNRVLREATGPLGRCFTQRLEALPYLSGHVELRLRVGVDGAVRWAIPTDSTLGDREVERCMTEHARTLRFEAPCGGEAEVCYPMDLDASDEARPATAWPTARVARAVTQHHAALAACRRGVQGRFRVTVYVAPDGHVAAVGTTLPGEGSEGAADCVVREVSAWRLPSPGSWYARTTFEVE